MVDYFCISNLVHIPYLMERMIQFNISSLSSRRRTAKLCHLYKVIYRLVDCENAPVAHRALQYTNFICTIITIPVFILSPFNITME